MSRSERAPIPKFQATSQGGLLIGLEAMDYELEAGGHPADIQPLKTALTDPKWEKATGINKRGWTIDNAVAHAHFLARVYADGQSKKLRMPSKAQFTVAHHYGLSPEPSRLGVISGGVRNIYRLSGLKAQSEQQRGVLKFRNITFSGCRKIARRIMREYGRFDESTIMKAHKGGWSPLKSSFAKYGTLAHMREHLGMGFDIASWDIDDYTDWGVDVMTANGGWLPNMKVIADNIRPEWRPSATTIRRKIGELKFRKLVEDKYEMMQRDKSMRDQQLLEESEKLELPTEWLEQLDDERKIEIVKIVKLSRRLGIVENLKLEQLLKVGAELRFVLRRRSEAIIAEIEREALRLDAMDLLYPELKPDLTKYIVPAPSRRVRRK